MKTSIKFKITLTTVLLSLITALFVYISYAGSLSPGMLLTAGIILVLLILSSGLLLSNRISSVLSRNVSALQNIATHEGGLSARLDGSGSDEISRMNNWFNSFVGRLGESLHQVSELVYKNNKLSEQLSLSSKNSAQSVSSISGSILSMKEGTVQLDQSIYHASASIEEIMQSIESLNRQVEHQFAAIEQSSSSTNRLWLL